MKLFVILSRFPFPLEKGDKLRAYHQIKHLSKDHDIILCCLSDKKIKPEWKEELNKYCQELHVFELKKPLIYWNTFKQLFTGNPYQVGYFYQHRVRKKIDSIIDRTKPAHIYCQLIRTAEYVKNHHDIPKTIDYMDALGKGMLRRSAISRGTKRKLFSIEGKRLTEYENRIFDYFNHHTIISEQDKRLINHPDNHKITVIENGIAKDFFDFPPKNDTEYELVFTGNMNYPPNIECSEFIVRHILPTLQKKIPGIKLLLSGANPNQRIIELGKNEAVTVTGWVDDIKDSYSKGKIFLAPLFIGTGLQNKLLEAMAMRLPCITTSLVNNALNCVDGTTILLAENANEFISQVENLLNDQQLYEQISHNARNFVADNFNWNVSVGKLNEVLKS